MHWAVTASRGKGVFRQPKEWRGYAAGLWAATVQVSRRGWFVATACVCGIVLWTAPVRTLEGAQRSAETLFLGPAMGVTAFVRWARRAPPGVKARKLLAQGGLPTVRQQVVLGMKVRRIPAVKPTAEETRIAHRLLEAAGIPVSDGARREEVRRAKRAAQVQVASLEDFRQRFNQKHHVG